MKVCFNGHFFPADASLLPVQNRGYKWGDGCFETMKVWKGRLLLETLHFERLFISLQLLQIGFADDFSQTILVKKILALCAENDCAESARIRLAVYRTEENKAGYSIEAIPLEKSVNAWNQEGIALCLYPYARKPTDAFANIKSANYLPYVLAARFAAERGADDALVLNTHNRFCDSSKANLFLIKGNKFSTPTLYEGCINGVMRRVVMEEIKRLGYRLQHDEVTEDDLLQADEVFLTNAIQIIRWVKSYKSSTYTSEKTTQLFAAVHQVIFGTSL